MPLSIGLNVSPRRYTGLHPWTRLWSKFCLSPQGSACLLAESRARTAGQGLGAHFASLHQAQHFYLPSRGLAAQNKAWVYVLPLSTRVSVFPPRFKGSHRRTRLGSTLCLFLLSSALLLTNSRACSAGQGFGLRFASLHQVHRVSSPINGLAPQDKTRVYDFPLSSRLSVSPR